MSRILCLAVGKLAGQITHFQRPFSTSQFPGFASCLARASCFRSLEDNLFRHRRIFLEKIPQLLVEHCFNETFDLAVAQLCLCLALELRIRQLDRDDRGQPLSHIIAGQAAFHIFQQVVGGRVVVHGPCEGSFEPHQMAASLVGIDVVGI